MKSARISGALIGLLVVSSVQAARPMITDDARLTDPQACQVETWAKRNRHNEELWALPACNLTGNFEITMGGAIGHDPAGSRTTDVVAQAKTLFKPLETNGWGMGLVVGNVRHPNITTDRNLIGDVYAYVPTSFSYRDDRYVLHTNLGWLHRRTDHSDRLTWGVGSETELRANTWLIAEFFGQDRGRAFYQAGIRYWLVPGHVQLDTTYGNRMGSTQDERWFSLGLRLISPRLF